MLAAEITMAKGSTVPDHSHPHEQVGYVARGRLEFTLAGQRIVLSAGDGYAIPGDAPHSVLALEDSIALDVFSPVREEYKA
ncbi:MAG: cupin domain-containing protein [Chloroflexi bacterium]|nr:cupin domain-containing protein [Chloroflexota bacterium]